MLKLVEKRSNDKGVNIEEKVTDYTYNSNGNELSQRVMHRNLTQYSQPGIGIAIYSDATTGEIDNDLEKNKYL